MEYRDTYRDCKKCYPFNERAAIIEFSGGVNRTTAEQIARFDTCYGCVGAYGVGLLDTIEYSNPVADTWNDGR